MRRESRAEEIAREILSSERYANARAFEDRIYRDEPILRTGAQAFNGSAQRGNVTDVRGTGPDGRVFRPRLSQDTALPTEYRRMRAIARKQGLRGGHAGQSVGKAHLFYLQGKYMEDFEEDFDGQTYFDRYYPSYEEMSNYQLRCYFSWRTRYRAGQTPDAPLSFLFVHAYELLCGIGTKPGQEGFEALSDFAAAYAGASPSFDMHMKRWRFDYAVFYGLDGAAALAGSSSFPYEAVSLLHRAEDALLARGCPKEWPQIDDGELPGAGDLLDALCALSRYRAERSRFVKAHREDVAEVSARVFGCMVTHCKKRRKMGYVQGIFGSPTLRYYTMFASALFWTPVPHSDATYVISDSEKFVCENGMWWRELPCRRAETSKEIGALLHAIDARLRVATGDPHPLKERSLPKYQAKFVDEGIAALLARKKAEEAARIRIDPSRLAGIRSAAARTREALLTDEERADDAVLSVAERAPQPQPKPELEPKEEARGADDALGLSGEQLELLVSLLAGEVPQTKDSLFLTLAVDAINEAFLDVVGDTVVEFDGETPVLVEDYADDVRAAL